MKGELKEEPRRTTESVENNRIELIIARVQVGERFKIQFKELK